MVGALNERAFDGNRTKHGRGTSAPSKRQSATEGRNQFQGPPQFPTEALPPGRLIVETGAPVEVPDIGASDASGFGRMIDALKALKGLSGSPMGRRLPLLQAFAGGWELGDYLWDKGFRPFGAQADDSVYPAGWHNTHSSFLWQPCSVPACYDPGTIYWSCSINAHWPNNAAPTCAGCLNDAGKHLYRTHALDSPWQAYTHSSPQIKVLAQFTTNPARAFLVGQYFVTSPHGADKTKWVQDLVPGVGVPIAPPLPMEEQEVWPMEYPMQMPTPQRWKEAAPDPVTRPYEQPRVRPLPPAPGRVIEVPLVPGVPPVIEVVPAPVTPVGPIQVPDQIVEVSPDPQQPPRGTTRPPSGSGPGSPAPPGTREKKLNIRTAAGKAWVVINMVTESLDFIGAMYSALPDDCKSKAHKTPHAKVKAVYDCWDHLTDEYWSDFIVALINNQFEDFLYGKAGKAVGKATRDAGITTGLNRALKEAQENWDQAPPLPELEYNDGVWTLTWGDDEIITTAPE